MAKNFIGAMQSPMRAGQPQKRPDPQPKGLGGSVRNSAGPMEDRADKAGDGMRPMGGKSGPAVRGPVGGGVDIATSRPGSQTGRTQAKGSNSGGARDMAGSGHMGGWADKMHPMKGR